MSILINLQKYRQLRAQPRTDPRGNSYLVLQSLWKKWDGSLNPVGWFVLYPSSAEKTLERLEEFQKKFFSKNGLEISRLPNKESQKNWQMGHRAGGLFSHRAVREGKNFAVITFHPSGSPKSSTVWIHEADLAVVIAFIREQLVALSSASASTPTVEKSGIDPKASSALAEPSESISSSPKRPRDEDPRPDDEFEAQGQEFADRLEEMEDSWRERQEEYSASYDEVERIIQEDWPYPDKDEE